MTLLATPVRRLVAVLLPFAVVSALGCDSLGDAGERGTTTRAATTAPSSPVADSPLPPIVKPYAETPDLVVGSGDDADDVALHPSGYIIGTNKDANGGLEVYDVDGRRTQWLQLGETNNVDLRGDLVVSSNRSHDRVDLFAFKRGRLRPLRSFDVPFDPYGICLYRDTVVVTANDEGRVEQYSLRGSLLRRLTGIDSQSEGCVADDAGGILYIAEEARGIWKFSADPDADGTGTLVDSVEGNLAADVEGLTLVEGYLIASSQGDSTFAVYRNDVFLGRFRVAGDGPIDEVSDTDGLDASASLDLLVVHDHKNTGGATSNYKLVDLSILWKTSS